MGWEEDLEKLKDQDTTVEKGGPKMDELEEEVVKKRPSINELLKKYPKGFCVSSEGVVGKILLTTTHLDVVYNRYPKSPLGQLYLVIQQE